RRGRYIAPLPRIARAPDRTHARLVRGGRCAISPRPGGGRGGADGGPALEVWAARPKGGPVEEPCGRQVRVARDPGRHSEGSAPAPAPRREPSRRETARAARAPLRVVKS